jgi:hypothetical protein
MPHARNKAVRTSMDPHEAAPIIADLEPATNKKKTGFGARETGLRGQEKLMGYQLIFAAMLLVLQ